VTELAGGVAHDFNNLLAAIINFASFVDEEVSRAASEPGGERWLAVHSDIEQVTRAAKRASQLTHQLLAFARREVVQPRVVNLNGVVAETEQLLPATSSAITAEHESEPTPTRPAAETILVTEHEDAIREVARRILTRNGHTVLLAEHGVRALELLDAFDGEIHLLLTDVVMPGMQGKELAEEARRHRPGLRVLYMSGYAQPVLASQGTLDAGVVLLEKPFTERSLLARVREVLDS
jgi:CheY-like chemotaxis protein